MASFAKEGSKESGRIKCFQWNVLADGLSDDGFIVPLMGKGDRVPIAANSPSFKWDASAPFGMNISEETSASIADYISDSASFGSVVIPKVRAALKAVFGDAYADKVHMKPIGQYARAKASKEADVEFMGIASKVCADADQENKFVGIRDEYMRCLDAMDRKWNLRLHAENLSTFLSWERRGDAIAAKILKEDPDIITLQELDKFAFLQDRLKATYASSEELLEGVEDVYSASSPAHADYASYFAARRFAFAPKCNSTARKIAKGSGRKDPDDDGCALMWKADRFKCLEIRYHYYGFDVNEAPAAGSKLKGGGAIAAHLEERGDSKRRFWAIATHLESGDKEKDVDKRVVQVKSLAAFVNSCEGDAKILGMDGNAFPFLRSKYASTDVDNMYTTLSKLTQMENYEPLPGAVTVNKIRGVMSGQPYKIGAYQ